MKKSLLVLCYPTYSNVIHLDSKGTSIVLAPDEIINSLNKINVAVNVVNMSPHKSDKPLLRSKLNMIDYDQSCNLQELADKSDVCWHMFRDPTQPEVASVRHAFENLKFDRAHIINPISALDHMYKDEYMPILEKYNIGPKISRSDEQFVWEPSNHGASINRERTLVMLPNYNNNRGDYPERERSRGFIKVEFLDSAVDGVRSFFRVGFAKGKLIPGWLYSSPAEQYIQKTGTCKIKEPHEIPSRFHDVISKAMVEIGIDVCHIEGVYVKGEVKLFDINPYPTTYGKTLQPISDAIAHHIARHFRWTS